MAAAAEAGDTRLFRLGVDVRSIRAGRRLPMKAINAFVKVLLPREILGLAIASPSAGSAAKLAAPLRTHPPVMVQKGSEALLPNGYVALELPASVSGLAAALAKDPCLQAEVFHCDKYAADSLIGSALIPMAPLMSDPWLDGYAPVYSCSPEDDQVTVGALRVVLSAEELGPVPTPCKKNKKAAAKGNAGNTAVALQLPSLEDSFIMLKKDFQSQSGSKAIAVQTELHNECEKDLADRSRNKLGKVEIVQEDAPGKVRPVKQNHGTCYEDDRNSFSKKQEAENDIRKRSEYELSWQLQMWRRSEEAKWKADLKEKESKRLTILETEWKQRERTHMAQLEKTRSELINLENKLRAKLFVLEKRERTFVFAEETALLRKEALIRDYAQRASDAEVAVKRLQAECDHRVELEHTKYATLKDQYAVLEKRLATANDALAKVERQFATYRVEQQKTSTTDLAGQLILLTEQCNDFQRRIEHAVQAKNSYKSQVLKLKNDLLTLHQRFVYEHQYQCGKCVTSSFVESPSRKRCKERLEFQQLKDQLERLKMCQQTTMSQVIEPTRNIQTENPNSAEGMSRHVPKVMKDEAAGISPVVEVRPLSIERVVENLTATTGVTTAVSCKVNSNVLETENCVVDEAIQVDLDSGWKYAMLKEPAVALENQSGLDEATQVDLDSGLESEDRKWLVPLKIDEEDNFDEWLTMEDDDFFLKGNIKELPSVGLVESIQSDTSTPDQVVIKNLLEQIKQWNLNAGIKHEDESTDIVDHQSCSPCLHLSAFQQSEIERLRKQREELLQTRVYRENDRMIVGLDEEILRLESVDTKRFNFV